MKHYKLLLASFIIVFACTPPEPQSDLPVKPNFLFLFADDQAYNALGSLNEFIQTPNIDRLMASGKTFTHCYNQGSWSGAVCVVSRAMLNSGLYIYHARDRFNEVPLWGQTFQEAGYSTFLTGKWHNGAPAVLRSFEQAKSVGKGMFETKGGPKGPGYRRPTAENNTWQPYDTSLTGHWRPQVWDVVASDSGRVKGEMYVSQQHTSELYADNAIDFLNNHIESDERPFFMYVAFNAPHDPRQSPKEYVDLYPAEDVALPVNFLPEHPFDQGERYTLRDEILGPFPRTEEAVKTQLGEYYAIITHMDAQIGRILDALEESGQMENTYIMFSADHGLAMGSHGLFGKQNAYDHSIRMPFAISGPGIEAGSKTDDKIYLQSLFPTTCDLANIPIPEHVEFPSLVAAIEGGAFEEHPAIFGSYKDYQRLIRTSTHKLILYPQVEEVQLFDLEADPAEMNDIAELPENKELVQQLFEELLLLQEEVGDTLKLTAPFSS